MKQHRSNKRVRARRRISHGAADIHDKVTPAFKKLVERVIREDYQLLKRLADS